MSELYTEDRSREDSPRELFLNKLNPVAYTIVVLTIIFFLYQFIGSGIAYIAAGGDLENPGIMRVVLSVAQFVFILVPTVIFTKLQKTDLKTTFKLKAPKPVLVLLSISGIILIQPFLQGYINIQDHLINNISVLREIVLPVKKIFDFLEESTMKIVRAYTIPEFIVVVFVICVTPAICEEFLFRGLVLYNLRMVINSTYSITLGGLLFALYHFQPFNIIPLMILGSYIGFVVYYSGSIWTGVICHFLNNFMASYFLFISGYEKYQMQIINSDNIITAVAANVTSMLIFIVVVYTFYRMRDRREELI